MERATSREMDWMRALTTAIVPCTWVRVIACELPAVAFCTAELPPTNPGNAVHWTAVAPAPLPMPVQLRAPLAPLALTKVPENVPP
jgi:hypothetical protein